MTRPRSLGPRLLKNPITGIAAGCARTVSGHVTACRAAEERDELAPSHVGHQASFPHNPPTPE
jgi:hypothetical protein